MIKKIIKSLIVFSILTSFTLSYAEVKEILTIEEYSKQFLDENFILEDLKLENSNSLNEINVLEEEPLIEENEEVKTQKVEQNTTQQANTSAIVNSDENLKISEKTTENRNINWNIGNNFRAILVGDLYGNVIYSKNADNIYPLASVTKMMSLMVTFDQIKAGKASLNDKVRISKNSIRFGGSGIPLKAGQIFKLEDLIKASGIYSANNATYAIAEHIGKGSVSKFVELMNKKLKTLGLDKDIRYYTPAGLPTRMTKQPMDSGTARAIYKLSIEALKYKKYIQIAGIKNTTIHNGKIKIRNRNKLIGKNGVYGIKTGYHREAKYNIAVASKINSMDVIVVVIGGDSYTSRDKNVLDILDILKNNYHSEQVLNKNKSVGNVKIEGTNIYVPVVPDRDFNAILKNGEKAKILLKADEKIKTNIKKGQKLGKFEVYSEEKLLISGNILSQKNIKK